LGDSDPSEPEIRDPQMPDWNCSFKRRSTTFLEEMVSVSIVEMNLLK